MSLTDYILSQIDTMQGTQFQVWCNPKFLSEHYEELKSLPLHVTVHTDGVYSPYAPPLIIAMGM